MKNVITSKFYSIPQILLQILTWEGETYRLIYSLSTFGGVRSLKIRRITCLDYKRSEPCVAPYLALNKCMRWNTYINIALCYTVNFDT